MQPGRIQYFDLAKGICILLVVWFHLKGLHGLQTCVDPYLSAIRMPLYFFLSGFFFKTYDGFAAFLRKKTHKLLIPFAFFYLTTSVLMPILAHRFLGMTFNTGQDWHLLYAFLTYNDFPNIPLWFLWALFLLNVTFFVMRSHVRSDWQLAALSLVMSIVLGSLLLLPASLSKAMDGMMFFCLGYLCRRHDAVERLNLRLALPASAALFLLLGLAAPTLPVLSVVYRYLFSAVGVLTLISLCRIVGHLPYVSYVGRYSIMLLVTHEPIIRILDTLHIDSLAVCFLILSASYLVIIPLMRRYLPYVTAQKP